MDRMSLIKESKSWESNYLRTNDNIRTRGKINRLYADKVDFWLRQEWISERVLWNAYIEELPLLLDFRQ